MLPEAKIRERLRGGEEEFLEAIDESDFEYELDQNRFASFEEVH